MRGRDFNSIKPYVYWIKNNITGIKYFGVRWGNLRKKRTPIQDLGIKYFSSGPLKKDFIKNPENFAIKIIATFDTKEEARDYEFEQNKKNIRKKRYANISAYPHIIHTPETRKKMSLKRRGLKRPLSEETKRKIGLANKGRKYSDEYRKIMSLRSKGTKRSIESIRKMVEIKKKQGVI